METNLSGSYFGVLLVPVLFAMVLFWFVLIKLLFNRLERNHPQKYEAMGRPSLFLRNNIENGLATMKFLFAREHRSLGDGYLSKLSDFMLAFLIAYLLAFVALGFVIPAVSQQAHLAHSSFGNVA